MFYEQRYKVFGIVLFVLGAIFGSLQPWSIFLKEQRPYIFQMQDVSTIESKLYVTSRVVDTSGTFDFRGVQAFLSFREDEDEIEGVMTYEEDTHEIQAVFELENAPNKDFALIYNYKGFDYTLTTYDKYLIEHPEGRLLLGYATKWDAVIFERQKVLEVDKYNTIQETVQQNNKIRYRVSDYYYDEETRQVTVSITMTKSGARVIAGFTDNHEHILNFYKSAIHADDAYIKETYTIMLDDASTEVNTFFRVVAAQNEPKNVAPFELTFTTQQKSKNRL